MRRNKHSFKSRFQYWFDNKMAQGFWAKVRLLLLATLVFVFLVAFLAALAHGGIGKHFVSDFIRSFMYSLGKGGALNTDDTHVSVLYFLLMLLTILYCIFFTAILIGLITNAIRTKVEELGKGRSRVLEENHTLILGFNDAAFVLLEELIEANKNQPEVQKIVVLGELDQKSMIEQLSRRKIRPKRGSKTQIICRTGSIYNFDDLKRCAIEDSRVVIINAENDFDAVKATMACSHILKDISKEEGPFLVSVIQNDENLIESRLATGTEGEDRLVVLALNEVLARIMVHTSRQPGLSDVFTELLNFSDDEFYIIDKDENFTKLYGKSISDINHFLADAFAVGVKRDESIIIEEPITTFFNEGDALVVVKENDSPLKIRECESKQFEVPGYQVTHEDRIKVLIIGVQPVLNSVLLEYANYLTEESEICIVDREGAFDTVVEERVQKQIEDKGINLIVRKSDVSKKAQMNYLLSGFLPDSVLVLVDEDSPDADTEDELAMRELIYLREFRSRGGYQYSITCEMRQDKNKELAVATGGDDFIISRQISALLMSQISQNKEMEPLFETLLSKVGFEIYMKPAKWYLPMQTPIDLINAGRMVAERGEILIGLRQQVNGRYQSADINPPKYESGGEKLREYVLQEEDYIVVLSEDSHYTALSN